MMGEYVSMRLFGRPGRFRDFTAMGVAEGTMLEAAMLFHNWDAASGVIEVSGASETPRWLTREALRQMHAFPFDTVGAQLLVMRVDEEDTRLDRILGAGNYRKYNIPRLRGRNRGENIFTLTDDEWRDGAFWKRVRKEASHGQARLS